MLFYVLLKGDSRRERLEWEKGKGLTGKEKEMLKNIQTGKEQNVQ